MCRERAGGRGDMELLPYWVLWGQSAEFFQKPNDCNEISITF